MKIVIIGGGVVGGKIAQSLARENQDVVVVDKSSKAIAQIGSTEDILCVVGSAIDKETREEVGMDSADIVISCTDSDEVNMITALFARKCGVTRTVARIRNPEYFNQVKDIMEFMGISRVLNPELLAADAISRSLLFPAASSRTALAHGRVELVEFVLKKGNQLIGKTLSEIGNSINSNALISIVERGDEVIIPNGSTMLLEGDNIYITADHKNLVSFFKKIDSFKSEVKTTIILGGSRISYYLARKLILHGIKVKIIDEDLERCEKMSALLPKALVVNADGTNEELLAEEGIGQTDAFVALSDSDEVNAIVSLFASSKNVSKVVTKVSQNVSPVILKNIGVAEMVDQKSIIASAILRYIRAIEASEEFDSIDTLVKLANEKAIAIGFVIRKETSYTGVPLRKLGLKDGYLVACIVRDGEVILPGGDDEIKIGDHVIVITKNLGIHSFEEAVKK